MHTTKVTNFPESSASKAFANVRITVGEDSHINTSMSNHGNEVTIFFDSPAEIRQFASDLLTQASTKENL
jgi:hypothetical protein